MERRVAVSRKIKVTRSQVMAAQLRVDMDIEDGRETPEWIVKIANLGDDGERDVATETRRAAS